MFGTKTINLINILNKVDIPKLMEYEEQCESDASEEEPEQSPGEPPQVMEQEGQSEDAPSVQGWMKSMGVKPTEGPGEKARGKQPLFDRPPPRETEPTPYPGEKARGKQNQHLSLERKLAENSLFLKGLRPQGWSRTTHWI